MNDIVDLIGRFRDYLPDTSPHSTRFPFEPRTLRPLRRHLAFVAAASLIGVAAAAVMAITFTRSERGLPQGFTNHLSPGDRTTSVTCIVHVPVLAGQDQNDATEAALRMMIARATTLHWTAAEIVKLDRSRISVTAPGGGCDSLSTGLAAPFDISVIHLRDMQIVSADRLLSAVAQLPQTTRGMTYVAFQIDSSKNLPFTLGKRAASMNEARADQGVPRSQVIEIPREFDLVGLPGTTDTMDLPRRFAIYRDGANTVAAGTDVIGTNAVNATTLHIDLRPAASQRMQAIAAEGHASDEVWLRFGNDRAQPEHGLVGSFNGTDFTVLDAPMISRVVGGGNLVRSPQIDGPARTAQQISGSPTTLPTNLRSDALSMLEPEGPRSLPKVAQVIGGISPVYAFARDGSLSDATSIVAIRLDDGQDVSSFCGQNLGYPALTICRDVQPSRARLIGRSAPSVATIVASTDTGGTITASPRNGWFAIPQPQNGTAITRVEARAVDGRPIGRITMPLQFDFIPLPSY